MQYGKEAINNRIDCEQKSYGKILMRDCIIFAGLKANQMNII